MNSPYRTSARPPEEKCKCGLLCRFFRWIESPSAGFSGLAFKSTVASLLCVGSLAAVGVISLIVRKVFGQ